MISGNLKSHIIRFLGAQNVDRISRSYLIEKYRFLRLAEADRNLQLFITSSGDNFFPKDFLESKSSSPEVTESTGIVWQFWDKGWNSAPKELNVLSRLSEKALAGRYRFQRLDLVTCHDFIDVDKNILHLYEDGKVSAAGFADYLRLKLLHDYGGLWLDATVLVRKNCNLPQSFLVRGNPSFPKFGRFMTGIWLIASVPKDPRIAAALAILTNYWLALGRQAHYFDGSLVLGNVRRLELMTNHEIPTFFLGNLEDSTALMRALSSTKPGLPKIERIFQNSQVHKLSYKGGFLKASNLELLNHLWKLYPCKTEQMKSDSPK